MFTAIFVSLLAGIIGISIGSINLSITLPVVIMGGYILYRLEEIEGRLIELQKNESKATEIFETVKSDEENMSNQP